MVISNEIVIAALTVVVRSSWHLYRMCWSPQCTLTDLQATGLWGQMEGLKQVVCEPRQAGNAFESAIQEYYQAIKSGRGGLFMAVCRGKVRLHDHLNYDHPACKRLRDLPALQSHIPAPRKG
jgi:hypothetical protein